MVMDEDVLIFFRNELPILGFLPTEKNAVGMDDILQEYTEPDDLMPAIDKYSHVFGIDVSQINMDSYYPWKTAWFFRKWLNKKPLKQTNKPLTIRMFAESAKAGRWLYD
ncbi:DUF1493 family protein [Brenneria goodwinii]|uniref:DUF1493 family protein n=1 Tax=Brenneria goodwinii TaxID=1109412 RepID=UPI0036E73B46